MKLEHTNNSSVAIFNNQFAIISRLKLRDSSSRLFWFILGNLELGNCFSIPTNQVAKMLELDRRTVDKALTQLKEKNILFDDVTIGKFKRYKLNPHIAWNGDLHNCTNEQIKYSKLELAHKVKESKF